MVSSNDFKNGMTILYDGKIYKIMEFMHVKPGKGSAFVRTKLPDIRSGAVIDYTFNSSEKVELADIEKEEMQYLYDSQDFLVFMNTETYEQIEIPYSIVEYERKFLRENQIVNIERYGEEILGIILPDKVTLTVTEADPTIKGASQTDRKKCTLETGLVVVVPSFVEAGDKLIVSTIDGSYVSRA